MYYYVAKVEIEHYNKKISIYTEKPRYTSELSRDSVTHAD